MLLNNGPNGYRQLLVLMVDTINTVSLHHFEKNGLDANFVSITNLPQRINT